MKAYHVALLFCRNPEPYR